MPQPDYTDSTTQHVTLVDGHVHLHDHQPCAPFLDGAVLEFERAARRLGYDQQYTGCLMMADLDGQSTLDRLKYDIAAGKLPGWTLQPTNEEISVLCRRDDGHGVTLISGRQVDCSDGLEVLALCYRGTVRDSCSAAETLERIEQEGGLPILPWGVGKWLFQRGSVVRSLISSQELRFDLGDNSSRFRWYRRPPLFDLARRYGRRILPGSDPLPIAREKVGDFGCIIPIALGDERPANAFRQWWEHGEQPQCYGNGDAASDFVTKQITMQWRKRRSR